MPAHREPGAAPGRGRAGGGSALKFYSIGRKSPVSASPMVANLDLDKCLITL